MKFSTLKHAAGFTLIELMVVIAIVAFMTLASYIPYAHHQKKVVLNQGAKEVSQSLRDARNLALHGFDSGSGNLNVGLHFVPGESSLSYYSSTGALSLATIASLDPFEVKKLPAGIQIENINDSSDEFLLWFERISGSGSSDPSISDPIHIALSYGGSDASVLQKNISYFMRSAIADY